MRNNTDQNYQKNKKENKYYYKNCLRWWPREKKQIRYQRGQNTHRAGNSLVKFSKICSPFLTFIWKRSGRVFWAETSIKDGKMAHENLFQLDIR